MPAGETGFGGVLKTVFGNPGYTATTVLERDKILYLLQIMAPLAFFPWRRPIGLLCSVPGFFFTMLATKYPMLTRLGFQYTAYWTSFLFLAVVANLRWLDRAERRGVLRTRGGRCPPQPPRLEGRDGGRDAGDLLPARPRVPAEHVVGGLPAAARRRRPADHMRHDDLYSLIGQIPADASVAASEMLVAHVSSRKNAHTLKHGHFDADYILVRSPPAGTDFEHLVAAIRTGQYGWVAEKGNFVLFRRGAPPATAEAYLLGIGAKLLIFL